MIENGGGATRVERGESGDPDASDIAVGDALQVAYRTPSGVLGLTVFGVIFALLPAAPGAHAILRVGVTASVIAFGQALVAIYLSTWVYWRFGVRSRIYVAADILETASIHGCLLALVFLSERADSVYWALYAGQTMTLASTPHLRRSSTVLLSAGPLLLAAGFLARGLISSSIVTLAVAGVNFMVFHRLVESATGLAESILARDAMARRVKALEVEAQRARIARDLHDSVASDLAALGWRAAGLARRFPQVQKADVEALAGRARTSLDRLREVVGDLRRTEAPWSGIVAELHARCEDLCGGQTLLAFSDETAGAVTTLERGASSAVMAVVAEGVHNAVRHGSPASVEVALAVRADRLTVTVVDDGRGFRVAERLSERGGIAGLRARAAEAAGTLVVESSPDGTTLRLELPIMATESRPRALGQVSTSHTLGGEPPTADRGGPTSQRGS